jgi:hypothetical protein
MFSSRVFGARAIRNFPNNPAQLNAHLQRQSSAIDAAFSDLEQTTATRSVTRAVPGDGTSKTPDGSVLVNAKHGDTLLVSVATPVRVQLPRSSAATAGRTVKVVGGVPGFSVTVLAYRGNAKDGDRVQGAAAVVFTGDVGVRTFEDDGGGGFWHNV